jgi:hypothetical protein
MAYLRLKDYYINIQPTQLNQITANDPNVRILAEQRAQEEIISRLTQKYDTAKEFKDTVQWSRTISYKGGDLVYLDALPYTNIETYSINDLVSHNGSVYINVTPVTSTETFDAAKWSKIGVQHDLFHVTLPKPEFNITTKYAIGDEVFYNDKTYTAIRESIGIYPDDTTYGTQYWGTGVAYSVIAGTLPTDTTKWTVGDNRSQKIVEVMIDIALYKIHSRIATNNVPEIREMNYAAATAWLKSCAEGDVTADIPVILPRQGNRIRHGGVQKQYNHY